MLTNICMIVRDRLSLTKQALESLEANTDSPYNVTIVDDQSEAPTRDFLIEWVNQDKKHSRTLIRNSPSRGVGWARNLCVYASEAAFKRGNFIYFSDNDAFFTKGWLTVLTEIWPEAKESGCRILGGYNHPFQQPNAACVKLRDPRSPGLLRQHILNFYNAVGTHSWLMEWETLDKYGKLHATSRGVRQSEDWEFCQRIIKDGFKVGAIVPHVVYHTGRTDTFGKPDPGANFIPKISGVLVE